MAEILLPNDDRPVMEVPHKFLERHDGEATPLVLQPHPFTATHIEAYIPPGWTVGQIVRAAGFPAVYDPYVRVWIDDWEVPRELWHRCRPKPGRAIYVRVVPQGGKGGKGGGKSILGSILMLVVVVVAAFVAPYLAGPAGLGFTAGTTSFAVAKGLIGLGITLIGGLLVQSLVKPPKAQQAVDQGQPISQRALLTGVQNRFEPYAFIPRIFGRRRVYPLLAAHPYTEAVGQQRYLRALLCVGWGPLDISEIKIGDTPISSFQNIEVEVREGWTDATFGSLPSGKAADIPQTLFTNSVSEEQFSVVLPTGTGIIRTTGLNASEISVDVSFPGGLAGFLTDGKKDDCQVIIYVEYRLVGTSTWTYAVWDGNDAVDGTAYTGQLNCVDKSGSNVVFGGRFKVPAPGQYEVRLTRDTTNTNTSTVVWVDRAEWTALRTIRYQSPINQPGVAYIAVRMKATDQFNGLPDQINCIAQSYLPVYDGSSAWAYQLSRNPAWAYADIMRRRGNERIIPDSRIDLSTIRTWALACDATAPNAAEPRWTVDSVYEGGSIFTGMRELAGHGRAAFILKDGKYSVVRDIQQTVPVQHITPRNSLAYSGSKPFVDYPHALRVNFVNKDRGYQDDSIVVYYDGYSAGNATKFETLDMPGCTSATLAWREARYHMAVGRLRPEEHKVTMDIESLRCQAGDLVQFSHDVVSIGLAWGRIASLVTDGGNTTGLVLDGPVSMAAGVSYAVRVRTADGTSLLYTLTPLLVSNDAVATLTLPTPVATASGPQAGDLYMFGEATRESAPMMIKRIEPGSDFTVSVVMMDHQPGVYTADTGTIPPFDSYVTQQTPIDQQRPPEPTYQLVSDETALTRLADGTLDARISVAVGVLPSSSVAADYIEVQYRLSGAKPYRQIALVPATQKQIFIPGVIDDTLYDVRVRTLTEAGLASNWVETLDYKVIGKTTPPPDVTGFTVNFVNNQAHLTWIPVDVLDLDSYRIRHSPLTSGATYANAIDLAPVVPASATSVVVPALTGTYFIKAVDVLGITSANPASSATIFQSAAGINAVATSTQNPAFSGAKTNVAGNPLVLTTGALFDDAVGLFDARAGFFDAGGGTVLTEGTYEFDAPVDLGAVYTSRVTMTCQTARLDYSTTFDAAGGLFEAREGLFDGDPTVYDDTSVELYIAVTNDNPSGSPVWSEWRRFAVGDYTARGLKFKAILKSSNPYATPSISVLKAQVDMPDRVVRGTNIASGAGTYNATFTPNFKVAPAVVIAAQNLNQGDYFTITSKTASGFSITFRNSAGTAVDRTFDYTAIGYGELG